MSYDIRRYALLEARPGSYVNIWFRYLFEYRRAFEVLVDYILNKKVSVNIMVHPILFVARHAVEVGLKANVCELKKYTHLGSKNIANSHKLTRWLPEFDRQVQEFFRVCESQHISIDEGDKQQHTELYGSLCELVNGNDKFKGLGVIDDGSINFRYPVGRVPDQNGKPIMKPVFDVTEVISVAEVEKLFNESMLLLENTMDVFSKYIELLDYYEE